MAYQVLSWASATSDVTIHAKHWANSAPRAVLVHVHGQGEHSGRYDHVANFFGQHQIAMLAYDQQGFGQSTGARGHAPSLDAYLDDVAIALDQAATLYPNTPIILYGHSMGGNVVLNYLLRRKPTNLKACIATGPWIRLAFEAPAIKVWIGRLLRSIAPKLSLSTELDTNQISRDKQVVAAYNADPLVHDRVSAAAGIALIEGANWLDAYAGPAPCPLLIFHGGADALTSAPASKAFAGRITTPVLHKEWPGLYHEVHNEPEQGAVLAEMLAWVEQQL
jgi:alpha-beta hydrolase superfamily lysophospholipase